jgi:hypothetical protein
LLATAGEQRAARRLPFFRSCPVLTGRLSGRMPDDANKLTPADPRDLAEAVTFALRFEGRKRKHDAAEYMAAIAAERVVRHLERAGFVVMRKPLLGGHSALGRGFESR